MVEELFRFVTIRPADPASRPRLSLRAPTTLQDALVKAAGAPAAIDAALNAFVHSSSFIADPATHPIGSQLVAIDRALVASPVHDAAAIREIASSAVPALANEVAGAAWLEFRRALQDTLVAHAFSRTRLASDLRLGARVLRLALLVEELAADPATPDDSVAAIVAAPLDLGDLPRRRFAPPPATPPRVTSSLPPTQAPKLQGAINELARIPVTSFAEPRPIAAATGAAGEIRLPAADALDSLRLSAAGVQSLSPATQATLRELALDPGTASVPRMLGELRHARLNEVVRITPGVLGRAIGGASLRGALLGTTGEAPASVGELRRIGVGDLHLVRQRLLRYETVEIAHIENVLAGESKVRDHRRRRMTDEFTSEDKETSTSEEQELSSTDRFELSSEVAETVREEFEVRAGLRVQASYGPSVEIEAEAEAGYGLNSERARRVATQLSREVVQKSVAKVEEKVRTQKSLRIVEEVEERNTHTLSNSSAEPRRGVYQWVSKVYEAQTFNYGLREMYEFDVPEPGAYLLKALKESVQQRTGIAEPIPFSLQPDDIKEETYLQHAATYGATADVEPPPEDWIVRTHAFAHEDPGDEGRPGGIAKEAQIAIGEDLEAVAAYVLALHHSGGQLMCSIGPHYLDFTSSSGVRAVTLGAADGLGYRGALRAGVIATRPNNALVTVHVLCRPTPRAREEWVVRTYDAIRQAHDRAVREYEDALAAVSVTAGVKLPERGPDESKTLAVEELRKACISIATAQHFDVFGAIESDDGGRAQVAFGAAHAQGPYARFFEQVFEWENVQFVLYPYYWGRKSLWEERVRMLAGANPAMTELLKSGSARVVVPLRPGFEIALDHYKRTGQVFGGDGVVMGDPDFLAIADEIRSRTDRDYGNPTPIGTPWEVHVPTSLVYVRSDGNLPSF